MGVKPPVPKRGGFIFCQAPGRICRLFQKLLFVGAHSINNAILGLATESIAGHNAQPDAGFSDYRLDLALATVNIFA